MSGFGDRLAQRQKAFKKGVDAEEARRKREDAAVQLRKQVREEALQKRRQVTDQFGQPVSAPPGAMDVAQTPPVGEVSMQTGPGSGVSDEQIGTLKVMIMSDDPQAQFTALQQIRKLLSVERDPPIQEVIASGVVPRVVAFLKEVQRPDLQFEAAWVLTNVASGSVDQTRVVVDEGALPIFVNLLASPVDDVREQAVWALGNIAGDSPTFRDLVLQSGGLVPVLTVLRESEKTSMMRNATWTLSNLCRGKPPPPFEWVSPALATLANLIYSTDIEVLTDSCWALSYMSDGPSDRIQAVIQAGVCRRLCELLAHSSPLVQTPALRVVGNIVTGDDHQTQVILASGAVPQLHKLLAHEKKNIKKESCWTLSNITAGNRDQIQEVLKSGLISPLLTLLQTADFDIKKEAAWVISNATSGGSVQQVEYLVEQGCIQPMVELLGVNDTKIVGVALEALENILKVGMQAQQEKGLGENPFGVLVEQADGLQKIERLQEDANEAVYTKAVKILESYFPLEDDDADITDGSIAGHAAPQQQFQFGAPVPQGGFTFGQS